MSSSSLVSIGLSTSSTSFVLSSSDSSPNLLFSQSPSASSSLFFFSSSSPPISGLPSKISETDFSGSGFDVFSSPPSILWLRKPRLGGYSLFYCAIIITTIVIFYVNAITLATFINFFLKAAFYNLLGPTPTALLFFSTDLDNSDTESGGITGSLHIHAPPSTTIVSPVINPAASVHKYRLIMAISNLVPTLLIGIL